MSEEESKQDDEKLEFMPEGETFGYISLDQARVRAIEHARDNRDFYGPHYSQGDLTWEVVGQDESEDNYDIRLSYRPATGFSGKPGVEQFTIDKTGPVTLRQILSQPRSDTRLKAILAGLGLAVVIGGLVGGLAGAGVFSTKTTTTTPAEVTATATTVTVTPDTPVSMESFDGLVTVQMPLGTVDRPMVLRYQPLSISQLPQLPEGFETTGGNFDLTLTEDGQAVSGPVVLNEPITITVNLTGEVIASAEGRESKLVIQHYKDSGGWRELPTTADFVASTASAQVDSLSLFALTLRRVIAGPGSTDTPEPPTPTATVRPAPTATPTLAPSPTPEATGTPIPVPTPTWTPTPAPAVMYKLDTEVEPANLGTVFVEPSSDDGRYPAGRDVVLTAQCSTAFGAWEGSVPEGTSRSSDTITVPMDRDRVLVAICLEPTPTFTPTPPPTATNTPTSVPTATPRPTATPKPVPGFILYVNGLPVLAGQIVVRVPGGNVTLHQPAQSNGTYVPGANVSMEVQPDIPGSAVSWQGVSSQDGTRATVLMRGERFVVANIVPSSATPTPAPVTAATAIPTPTPTLIPTPGPSPTPTHTPTPLPPGVTPPPTNTPTPTPTPTPTLTPTPTPAGGSIVFQTDRDGNNEIYVMNSDGSNHTNLTSNSAEDHSPNWSLDGTKIAFVSDRDGNQEIYVMNSDGSAQTRMTNNSANDTGPAWSPDGTKIAFESNRDGGSEIYVMNSDGSAQTRLTNNSAGDIQPTWSPGGTKIAFTSARDGNDEIYVMNADGSGQTRLTNNSANDESPAWFPGARIAFQSARDGNWEIYVMNSDGSAQTRLTNNSAEDSKPSWSPDGTKMAFQSDRDGGNMEIYVMNADGSGQTRVTNTGATEQEPAWGP